MIYYVIIKLGDRMKKITLVTGLYGSGKSEFCVNYAIYAQSLGYNVYLADLDVVNVYFRSREVGDYLDATYNIKILGNVLGNNVDTDIPHFSPNFFNALNDPNGIIIVDLAGSQVGLRMLCSSLEMFLEYDYDFYDVVNVFREDSSSSKQIIDYIKIVNLTSQFKITHIVNNANLIHDTTVDDILYGQSIISEVSDCINVGVSYTLLDERNNDERILGNKILFKNLLLRKQWQ